MPNKRVIRDGGMDTDANLHWGLRRAAEIKEWDKRMILLEEYPIFQGIGGKLSFGEKCGTLISDLLRFMSMIHLQIQNRPGS